ncbi:hypothetical protein DE4576_04825 [Mycobacterium marinum]|nr:hypothetical protein DE4576_04825 [Mycobacterium marinum]
MFNTYRCNGINSGLLQISSGLSLPGGLSVFTLD